MHSHRSFLAPLVPVCHCGCSYCSHNFNDAASVH